MTSLRAVREYLNIFKEEQEKPTLTFTEPALYDLVCAISDYILTVNPHKIEEEIPSASYLTEKQFLIFYPICSKKTLREHKKKDTSASWHRMYCSELYIHPVKFLEHLSDHSVTFKTRIQRWNLLKQARESEKI